MNTPHKIYQVSSSGMAAYVVTQSDIENGYFIGEAWEAAQLRDKLNALLDNCDHDGQVDEYDEQPGSLADAINDEQLTVPQAAMLAFRERNEDVPARTIRYAAKTGHIKGAERRGRDWLLPKMQFLHWVNNRPKPGPKG